MIHLNWLLSMSLLPILFIYPAMAAATAVPPGFQPPPAGKLYHGIHPGGDSDDGEHVTPASLRAYEQAVGQQAAWVYFSHDWYTGTAFPRATATWIRDTGAIPFIRLMLRSSPDTTVVEHNYTLQRLLDGQFDTALTAWARDAATFGTPLLVEYGTECNGQWFPWNGKWAGGDTLTGFGDPTRPDGPERFVAAYRHLVTLMRQAGATNITWVWHVNADDDPDVAWNRLELYYPGDDVVDWLAVSAYGAQTPTQSDLSSFRAAMDAVFPRLTALAPNKPIMVAEFGCTAGNPHVTPQAWAQAALDDLLAARWPKVAGVSWWNEHWNNSDKPGDKTEMRVQTLPALAEVFRTELNTHADRVLCRPVLKP